MFLPLVGHALSNLILLALYYRDLPSNFLHGRYGAYEQQLKYLFENEYYIPGSVCELIRYRTTPLSHPLTPPKLEIIYQFYFHAVTNEPYIPMHIQQRSNQTRLNCH
ncbi:unnamed protein product [Didymodactylos carnosus]|uniref:Uncharacterized protein n=1 Tax=Didymodactylos carnosus TaxID=1234261 RepID=A0A814ZWX1_9BILA|nr:unnamed protein product [Didymodactylos carnosus]CAF1499447.1 unnamed protein product [Didymodactylos carnosus]CAF4013853.1 unnamed protein product [Didymodactylos carnosus]CAF4288029.1 unnamed protein product [Didymodactylos carnosus]